MQEKLHKYAPLYTPFLITLSADGSPRKNFFPNFSGAFNNSVFRAFCGGKI